MPDANSSPIRTPISPLQCGVSALLWFTLLWAVYFQVPQFLRLFKDFAVEVSVASGSILQYASWVCPFIAVVAVAGLINTQSTRTRWILLFGLPLIQLLCLAFAIFPHLLLILDILS